MSGEIYVVMTGNDNELWPECLERNFVAMGFETPYFEAWHQGDYEAYLALEYAAAATGTPDADIKARATLWFNRATRLSESIGDLWLHRDGADLYWAETVDSPPVFDPLSDIVIIAKPTTTWSKRNRKTVALGWDSIHPNAKDYLVTQQALFHVANSDMKATSPISWMMVRPENGGSAGDSSDDGIGAGRRGWIHDVFLATVAHLELTEST